MIEEAQLEETEQGKTVTTDGWFALHVSEATWMQTDRFGAGCRFEGQTRFPQIGVHLRVMQPGVPACLYHRENAQEDFYVVEGECILLVEDEERHLRAGHFVHCPANTNHVFVGAGDGPCVVLMMGYRPENDELCYPVSEVAAKYGASVEQETADQAEAYGKVEITPTKALYAGS